MQLLSRAEGNLARFLAAFAHGSAYSSLTPACMAAACQRWPGALWEDEEVAQLGAPTVTN